MTDKSTELIQQLEEDFREQKRLAKLEKDKRQRYFEKKRRFWRSHEELFAEMDKMMLKHVMLIGRELK